MVTSSIACSCLGGHDSGFVCAACCSCGNSRGIVSPVFAPGLNSIAMDFDCTLRSCGDPALGICTCCSNVERRLGASILGRANNM